MKSLRLKKALLLFCIISFVLTQQPNNNNQSLSVSNFYSPKCMPKCLQCQNGPNSCTVCSQKQQCCNKACSSCQNQITCKACQQGFKLDQNLNICVSEFSCDNIWCNDCDYQNYICKKCYGGYFLNSQMLTCDKCEQTCIFCESLENCTLCVPGTYLQNGDCLKCKQNCDQCENKDTCDFCAQSYFIDGDKNCVKCMEFCEKCTSDKDCQQCSPKKYFDEASKKCVSCPQRCSQCVNQVECSKCEIPYFFNSTSKSCQTCSQIYPHCIDCRDINGLISAATSTVCYQCDFRYYVSKNQCLSCPDNCVKCKNKNICIDCAKGYFLNQSLLCEKCGIINCLVCQQRDFSQFCDPKYYFDPDTSLRQCLKCPVGCFNCDKFVCKSCLQGFYLQNGVCYRCSAACLSCSFNPEHCKACLPGYFKVETDWGRCVKCAQPCSQCINIRQCKRCIQGFYLQNDTCLPCSIQACDHCRLIEKKEDATIYFDKIFTTEKKSQITECLHCSQSYFLSNSSCEKCSEGCKQCTSKDFCLLCYRGYSKNQNSSKCIKCPQHSLSCQINPFNQSQLIVGECQMGYTRNQSNHGQCVPCPLNCKFCTEDIETTCNDCLEGYYRYDMGQNRIQCLKCEAPCMACQSATECLSCEIGFYMNEKDECIKCKQGCEQCDGNRCFVCEQGFRLNLITLQCQKCKIKNCKHCKKSPQACDSCQDGYVHFSSHQKKSTLNETFPAGHQIQVDESQIEFCYRCDESIQGCKFCSSPFTCTECFNGLILTDKVNNDDDKTTNSCASADDSMPKIFLYVIIGILVILCLILAVCLCVIRSKTTKLINKKVVKPNQTQTLIQTSQQSISPIDIAISSPQKSRNKKSSIFSSFAGINPS